MELDRSIFILLHQFRIKKSNSSSRSPRKLAANQLHEKLIDSFTNSIKNNLTILQ